MMKYFLCLLALLGAASTPLVAQVKSVLETYDVMTGERVVIKTFPNVIEAPNWSPDGQWLVYNSGGNIYRLAADGKGEPQLVDTGVATSCNNDHVIAADGSHIAVSSGTQGDWKSKIYIVPFDGGSARLVTEEGPSYLHGWSPDGTLLSYCAQREGDFDVYVIPAAGGTPVRLTTAPGLDDGPEFDPTGTYIWFNSVRTGTMQVWRMRTDGSEQTQMTFDTNLYAWFPHVSPDGKWVVYICYHKGDLEPGQHLADKHVQLRLMPAQGGETRLLMDLFGGQGTINVNSWAPDSHRFAFVSFKEN